MLCCDITRKFSPPVLVGAVWALLVMAPAGLGQAQVDYSAATVTDAYGNARPVYQRRPYTQLPGAINRRPAGQTYALDTYSVNRRGATGAIALPANVLAPLNTRAAPRPGRGRSTFSELSPWRRTSLGRYGGFAARIENRAAPDSVALFQRRQSLITATALNAPVHRAILRGHAGVGVPVSVLHVPFETVEEVPESAARLEQLLQDAATQAQTRARTDGWSWFHEGEYRRAARSFMTATLMEPQDGEARIGELFSHLSLGEVLTALAVQGELGRRDANPFLHQVDLTQAFPEASHAQMLRIQSQAWIGGRVKNDGLNALGVLVLWYVGEWDEAAIAAATLKRDHPGSVYASWSGKVEAARAALGPDRVEP